MQLLSWPDTHLLDLEFLSGGRDEAAGEVHDARRGKHGYVDVAARRIRKRRHNEVNRLVEAHQEARHVLVCDAKRRALADALAEDGNNGAGGFEHIAVAHHRVHDSASRVAVQMDTLSKRFGHAVGVDGFARLVGGYIECVQRRAMCAARVLVQRVDDVLCADDVRERGFIRVQLAERYLLHRRGVYDRARHDRIEGAQHGAIIADIADNGVRLRVHLQKRMVLRLVAREDRHLFARGENALHERAGERARAAVNEVGAFAYFYGAGFLHSGSSSQYLNASPVIHLRENCRISRPNNSVWLLEGFSVMPPERCKSGTGK